MASVLESLPRESRVAILRLRSLGDCVLTTPALDILKRARPDLRVAIVVEERFAEIFAGNPDVDEILPPGLRALRGFRPRLCLNLHGGTRSTWMTALSGARWRAGFAHFRAQAVYNVRIPRAQEILGVERKVHTAEHLAGAMFFLGARVMEIPRAKLAAGTKNTPAGRGYAVIHAVAATPAKTWGADGFVSVAESLLHSGVEPVFIGAAGDDLSPFAAYRIVQGAPLSQIKTLLSEAAFFVGNDSGPAHMAAAFGIPVIAIFSASDPIVWAPWRTVSAVLTAPQPSEVLDAIARLRVHA